jgi:hypothetical protein
MGSYRLVPHWLTLFEFIMGDVHINGDKFLLELMRGFNFTADLVGIKGFF